MHIFILLKLSPVAAVKVTVLVFVARLPLDRDVRRGLVRVLALRLLLREMLPPILHTPGSLLYPISQIGDMRHQYRVTTFLPNRKVTAPAARHL
jgi:hypothetical protein